MKELVPSDKERKAKAEANKRAAEEKKKLFEQASAFKTEVKPVAVTVKKLVTPPKIGLTGNSTMAAIMAEEP